MKWQTREQARHKPDGRTGVAAIDRFACLVQAGKPLALDAKRIIIAADLHTELAKCPDRARIVLAAG
jgi:hypothetical protein